MAEWLKLLTSDHGVADSSPAGGEILPEPKRRLIAQCLSCSPFHLLGITEILLKGTLNPNSKSSSSDLTSLSILKSIPESLFLLASGTWIFNACSK